MKAATLVIALLAASAVHAQDSKPEAVGLHLLSRHSNYDRAWNDVNLGIYARWSNGFTAGTLRNSEDAQSFYAGWTGRWRLTEDVQAEITLGGITGYALAPVLPLIAPGLNIQLTPQLSVRSAFIFNPAKGGAHAAHVAIEWKF